VTKNRSVFPSDESLLKLMYLATKDVEKKWKQPKWNWAQTIGQLAIIFPDRLPLKLR
jgi:transposase-like protein